MEGDTLKLTLSYGGGCLRHDFTLVSSSPFPARTPSPGLDPETSSGHSRREQDGLAVQLDVTVFHESHGDPCERYVTESYNFDLTPIKEVFQEAHARDDGAIVLHLWDRDEFVYTITYEF